MKRQKGSSRGDYSRLIEDNDDCIPLERVRREPVEPTIEAQIQDGDTLQAIALRFNCTVAELKRLNKIEKEYEIHARKILKVPITPHTILLEHLPSVHRSGHCSPKRDNGQKQFQHLNTSITQTHHNENHFAGSMESDLDQTLRSAASSLTEKSINDIILNTEITRNAYTDEDHRRNESSIPASINQSSSIYDQLLSGEIDDDSIPQPRPILRRNNDYSCSGSDCDMSWICLFICILALCFAIPLIYVLYIAEHLKEYQHSSGGISSSTSVNIDLIALPNSTSLRR